MFSIKLQGYSKATYVVTCRGGFGLLWPHQTVSSRLILFAVSKILFTVSKTKHLLLETICSHEYARCGYFIAAYFIFSPNSITGCTPCLIAILLVVYLS